LFRCQTVGKKIQHVADPNPHATNAGTPATLLWIHCNSMCKFNHVRLL
jgi:hypothetical protein